MAGELAKQIAEETADAYMADAYGESAWAACADFLLRKGYTSLQVQAVLRSKWMRWADDSEGAGNGNYTNSAAFKRYYNALVRRVGVDAVIKDIQELTRESFGVAA